MMSCILYEAVIIHYFFIFTRDIMAQSISIRSDISLSLVSNITSKHFVTLDN